MISNIKTLNDLQWIDCDNLSKDPEMRPYVNNVVCGILKAIDYDYLKKGSKRVMADLKRQNREGELSIAQICFQFLEEIDAQRYSEL